MGQMHSHSVTRKEETIKQIINIVSLKKFHIRRPHYAEGIHVKLSNVLRKL